MAKLKGVKFLVVPSTADDFRAALIALRSLDGKNLRISRLRALRGPPFTNSEEHV